MYLPGFLQKHTLATGETSRTGDSAGEEPAAPRAARPSEMQSHGPGGGHPLRSTSHKTTHKGPEDSDRGPSALGPFPRAERAGGCEQQHLRTGGRDEPWPRAGGGHGTVGSPGLG